MFIFLGILAFGIIIAIHELGHFLAARAFGVKVKEFAIGMGPKLFAKQGKETLYSLRALPFGGFCDMEGEHEEGDEPNPRSFLSQKRWRRIVILAAGSAANIISAFIIIFILTVGLTGFVGTTLTSVYDNFPEEGPAKIVAGDRFVELNGERLFYQDDINLFRMLHAGNPLIFTIDRDGELIEFESRPHLMHRYTLDGDMLYRHIYRYDNGELISYERLHTDEYEHVVAQLNTLHEDEDIDEYAVYRRIFRYDITYNFIGNNLWETIQYSGYQMFSFARMIRISISMMISGAAGVGDMAGIVGIVDVMNTVGQEAETVGDGVLRMIGFAAFIAVNVGIINMLPIPAMDGGRILFIFVTFVIEKVTRRPLDPKYEGYINTVALVLLLGLMAFLFYNDIVRIISNR